jgi:hypothetical protein
MACSELTCLRNAEMFLVQVHEFHLVVGHLLLVGGLEHEGDCIGLVLSLHCYNIIVGGAPQDLRHGAQVHAH